MAAPRGVVHVALLRGINVGGKNKLPMKDLVAIVERAGCEEVRSYIQSGNLILRAKTALAARLPELISRAIAKRFGYEVPVVTRKVGELQAVVERNPFLRRGADSNHLHVAFLATKPGAARVAELDPRRSSPDEFQVLDREIYLCCPNGVGRTRLTNQYFDSKLGTISTVRNWRTVLKLIDLAKG